jgi:hypothetical protein
MLFSFLHVFGPIPGVFYMGSHQIQSNSVALSQQHSISKSNNQQTNLLSQNDFSPYFMREVLSREFS